MEIVVTIKGTIPGTPIPKGRPRFSKSGHAYTPARTKGYEQTVKWLLLSEMQKQPIETLPKGTDVYLELLFRLTKRHRADLDNLIKSFSDAANGVLYEDDRQVMHIAASIRIVPSGKDEGTDYRVEKA